MPESSRSISPTAHYTGQVWYRNGLSFEELHTSNGELLYNLLLPIQPLVRFAMGASLEEFLLQRHLLIDHLLTQKIESGEVTQVVEIAAGLSPRGLTFAERYPNIQYYETDLSDMIAMKQELLKKRKRPDNHHMTTVDVLLDLGEPSLFGALSRLMNHTRGVALITEGLVTYFDRATLQRIWQRFNRFLEAFPRGIYITDTNPRDLNDTNLLASLFRHGLEFFVNRPISFPFYSAADARGMLLSEGFAEVVVYDPNDFSYLPKMPYTSHTPVRVIEAQAG